MFTTHQRGLTQLPILFMVLSVLGLALAGWMFMVTRDRVQSASNANANANTNQVVACTEEAKICPDGSAVGRTGPNCEFAPCPTNSNANFNANVGVVPESNTNADANVNAVTPTDTRTICAKDADCELNVCIGCYNKAANANSSMNNCGVYADHVCKCIDATCTAVKLAE